MHTFFVFCPVLRRYRGVGVQLTDDCVSYVTDKLVQQPVPIGFTRERLDEFWSGERNAIDLLIRHAEAIFVNHWIGPFFKVSANADEAIQHLARCFHARQLPVDAAVEKKLSQTTDFLRMSRLVPETVESLLLRIDRDSKCWREEAEKSDEILSSYLSELLRLHSIAQ